MTDIERTARFIALNKTCFNGLYRVNRSGIFNVPMGSNALRYSKASINVNDYKCALLKAEKDDFIYLDPPYHPTSPTANFTGYSDYGFGDNDQLQLAKLFVELNDRRQCTLKQFKHTIN